MVMVAIGTPKRDTVLLNTWNQGPDTISRITKLRTPVVLLAMPGVFEVEVSGWADEICVPLVRCNTFINEEE